MNDATKTTTYNAAENGWPDGTRGQGFKKWEEAGRPPYDSEGRELDPAGWPTGKMKDGSTEGGTKPAAAFDPVLFGQAGGYHYDPEFDTTDQVHAFDFPVKAGGYIVSGSGGGADGDVHFTVLRGETVLASTAATSFSTTVDETLTFRAFVNPDAVAVKDRVRAGEKAARASFNLYKA